MFGVAKPTSRMCEKNVKLWTVISLDLIDHAGQGGGLSAPEHALDDAIV